jgi:hypothetical protein
MIDWEDLAQQQVAEIQRALPESIKVRAREVPVFFYPGRDRKGGACLGIFQGCSLLDGPPAQLDQMPRITLFFDALARAAEITGRAYFSTRFELPTCTNWGITWGGTKGRSQMPAWGKGRTTVCFPLYR